MATNEMRKKVPLQVVLTINLNNDSNDNRNMNTGGTLLVLQGLLSVRGLFRTEGKENLKKSKLIHIQSKSAKCPSIFIVKNLI